MACVAPSVVVVGAPRIKCDERRNRNGKENETSRPSVHEDGHQGTARTLQSSDAGRKNRKADEANGRLTAAEGDQTRHQIGSSAVGQAANTCRLDYQDT